MRRRLCLTVVLASLGVAVLAGCRASGPPRPTPAVNATIGEFVSIIAWREATDNGLVPSGDARVHVRCRPYREFGQRKRDKDWIEHWYVVIFDVVEVLRGTWPEDTVSFIVVDAWPTPESGIMVDKVWLYQPGTEFLFELRTDTRPATIVGQAMLPPVSTQSAVP
ncbi:MAG: hypothetical protein JXO22_01975 [Phycisphaerae bacterium]|nr:hypothetical protein [Phycisphaerae bacterium]